MRAYNTWLHHIGQSYYKTANAFNKEAKKHGVTRRVALKALERMQWGDGLVFAMKHGKTRVIFAEASITKISGLTRAAYEYLHKISGVTITGLPIKAKRVTRGCGTYYVTAEYTMKASAMSLREIAAHLMKAQHEGTDIGRPMIGCDPIDFTPYRKNVRVRNIPHSQGYRLFDYDKYQNDSRNSMPRNGLSSLYYVCSDDVWEEASDRTGGPLIWGGSAKLEEVANYVRKEDLDEDA